MVSDKPMSSDKLSLSPLIAVRRVAGIGRDLVVRVPIRAGTWLTRDPVIELDAAQCELVDRTLLGEYYLRHPDKPGWGCLALGPTSLVNHADRPNAKLAWSRTTEAGLVVGLEALRDLEEGQSVTLDYDHPLWFVPAAAR